MLFREQQGCPTPIQNGHSFQHFSYLFQELVQSLQFGGQFIFGGLPCLKLELPLVKAFFLPLSVQILQVITFFEVSY